MDSSSEEQMKKTETNENNNNNNDKIQEQENTVEIKVKEGKKEKKVENSTSETGDDETDLLMKEIVDKLRDPAQSVEVKNRTYHFSTYPKCFEGKDLVNWLIKNGYSKTRDEAVAFGNLLMGEAIFFHVTRDHIFKDEVLFYRFKWDDPDAIQMPNDSWIEFVKETSLDIHTNQTSSLSLSLNKIDNEESKQLVQALSKMEVLPLSKNNLKLLDRVHPPKYINPKPKPVYNMVVLGAGSAGLVCAAGAAGIGAKVAIVEENLMGGDCLNWGCVPSKSLIRAAHACYEATHSQTLGVHVENVKINFPQIMERMRKLRAEISKNDSVKRFAEKLGVNVFIGKGTFISKDKVQVSDEQGGTQILKFKIGVIATGARPSAPPIKGLDKIQKHTITNEGLFNLTELPKKFIMIGAGPIGCEMAQAFRRFGSEVFLIELLPQIMGREDSEAAKIIHKQFLEEGIHIYLEAQDLELDVGQEGHPIRVCFKVKGKEYKIDGDKLLFSTGRLANVDNLGLKEIGIKYDQKRVEVNDYLQTNISHIYACGDVCTPYKFTHMADSMARIIIRNSLFFNSIAQTTLVLPWCTYTHPEVAHVGAYEHELEKSKIPFQVFRASFADNDRAILEGAKEGFVKIFVKEGKDEILGATIVANNAGDMISEITAAMVGRIGLTTFSSIIHPYPTQAAIFRKLGDDCARQRLTPTVKIMFRQLLAAKR